MRMMVWNWGFLVSGVLASWVMILSVNGAGNAPPPCNFPAMYNFGDSNSDTGENSAAFLPVLAPNGVPYFHKPMGRDSDGRLIIDFIAEHLKLPYLHAYLNSLGANFRHGANFASGGATITKPKETIYENGISPFYLGMQIEQFVQFKTRSIQLYREANAVLDKEKLPIPEEFAKAIYTFDIGQNDLSYGFRKMSFEQLRATLPDIVNQLASAVQHLYKEGGRTFWIHNTGPIGCLPVQTFYLSNPAPGYLDKYGCINAQNNIAVEFNRQLHNKVIGLRTELRGASITYVDVYTAKYGMISNTKKLGYADPLKVCCGYHVKFDHVWCGNIGSVNGSNVHGDSCKDPSRHISWDGVHYTQAANQWVADHIINGSLTDPPVPILRACRK